MTYDQMEYDEQDYELFPGEGTVMGIVHEIEEVVEDALEPVNPRPVAVHEVGGPRKTDAADFGSWVTWTLNATAGKIQVLKRNPRRDRATILVVNTVTAQPVTDGAIFGSAAQCSQTSQPAGGAGGFLPLGEKFIIQNKQELYAVYPTTNTDPVYVTVLDETYTE